MPFDGNGNFAPSSPSYPAVSSTPITAAKRNALDLDFATGLSNCVTRDGQSPPTADLPMGGMKLTGLGAGAAAGDSLRYEQLFDQGSEIDLASAATVDIGGQNTNFIRITGTTTISSFGTNYNGPRFLRFAASLSLTYNAATMILPGGQDLNVSAGDSCIAVPVGAGTGWQVLGFQSAVGVPAFSAVPSAATSLTSGVEVKVTFGSEQYDYGSYYDAATSRWTPPAGVYHIGASVGLNVSATLSLFLYVNGVKYRQIGSAAQAVNQQSSGWVDVLVDGNDYLEIYALQTAATQNNNTTGNVTWFMGHRVRPL